jgi:hypothetical protein
MKTNFPKNPSELDLSNFKISKSVFHFQFFYKTLSNIFNLFTKHAVFPRFYQPHFILLHLFLSKNPIFYDLSEEGEFKIYIIIYWYDELTYISPDLYLCYLIYLYLLIPFTFSLKHIFSYDTLYILGIFPKNPHVCLSHLKETKVGHNICPTF